MLKKFINGLIFGTGFAIAFIFIIFIGFYLILPITLNSTLESDNTNDNQKFIATVPSIRTNQRFLGSTGIYSGDFINNKTGVLAKGPGIIVGTTSVNGNPLEGVKLRLALNGSVLSQWAISDSTGQYTIYVPFGKYVIDGYQMDHKTADLVLPNKIAHPQNAHTSNEFYVSEDNSGRGLSLRFVDPVIKKLSKNKYASSEHIVLEWEPYKDAATYSIQLNEKTDPGTWSNDYIFKWSDKPVVKDPYINLNNYAVILQKNHFYVLEVLAMDNDGKIISKTTDINQGYDFEIID